MTMRPTPPHPDDSRQASVEVCGAGTVGLRIHEQPRTRHGAPVVLYFHGGAFTRGSGAAPTALVRALHAAGAVVVAIDYPLAPAHPFPQAVEAGHAALCWLKRERVALTGCRSALLVAGEEAGGNLAAAAALMARDRLEPKLSGTILLCPMLDPCVGTASLRRTRAGPVGCKWADGWAQYLANPADVDHPYAVPASALRQSGLPPTLLITASDDPLHDEARSYGARLRTAGVTVQERLLPAPTGWPETLLHAAPPQAPWYDALLREVRDFLAAVA
ncbi:MAG: alpha/beta hydrolase fold domain-containing protein [Pseudomonadota bacterium]